jgi:para-nitrobenzyl esterase
MGEAIVETTSGKLRGATGDGVMLFKGIAYAGSPTGERRFLPPPPLEAWGGVRDALEYGASSPQPPERPPGWSAEEREDEDCLVLNVWSPSVAGRRPVMVWFHGGGYAIGSGSWPLYDGAALARRGDVVVVTVNHRLGALGYLHLGELAGPEHASSGNAGMLDLVRSLEWVRDNIEAFGGDPDNVTIFGESGGGAKVSLLLAMPQAHGLFHRAAVQSGPGLFVQAPEEAATSTQALLSHRGIEPGPGTLRSLQELPSQAIVEAQRAVSPRPRANAPRRGRAMGGFTPVLDGTTVTAHPNKALADGTAADVPVLIGRNRDEATLFLGADPALSNPELLDEEGLHERLAVFGDRADTLLNGYRKAQPGATPLDLLIAIQTDSFMGTGTIRFAERKIQGATTPVFMYLFCWAAGPLRASHGFEIPFVFDNARPPVMKASESRAELAGRMSEAWIAFAREGDPNHPGLPKWPSYSLDERATMIFDRGHCQVENDPFSAQRLLWSGG